MNSKIIKLTLVIHLFLLILANSSFAALTFSFDPDIAPYPSWYRDSKPDPDNPDATRRVKLQPCTDAAHCVNTPAKPPFDPNDPTKPNPEPGDLEQYCLLKGTIGVVNRVTGETKVFLNYSAGLKKYELTGTRVTRHVINYVEIELRNLPRDGSYTLIHPYGTDFFPGVVRNDKGERRAVRIIRTGRISSGEISFRQALNGPVTQFMEAVKPDPPVGFIGNGTDDILHEITGAKPGHNRLRLIGPNGASFGEPPQGPNQGTNVIERREFQVMGQKFQPAQ